MGPQVVSLLDHQEQDHCPDQGRDPGPGHADLQPHVVGVGDVLKVAHIGDAVVLIVPESLVLGVKLVVAVILLQLVMVGSVSQQRATRDGLVKSINNTGSTKNSE